MTAKAKAWLVVLLACGGVTAARAGDFPILQVSKGERSIVLVGSQHVGLPEAGRAQAVDALVARSNSVCMEADPRDPSTVVAGAKAFANPPGKRLQDRLSPATYQAVRQHLAFLPAGATNIDRLSPYGAATLLTFNITDLRKTLVSMKTTTSLDADILTAVQRHGKNIVALERPDAFSESLAQLSDHDWDTYLAGIVQILDCKECANAYGANMVKAYAPSDNYEEVNRSITRAFSSRPALGKTYDQFYFAKRNREMARAIERDAVEGGKCSVVAIGVGHLGGEHGVVALLRKDGLQVKPPAASAR